MEVKDEIINSAIEYIYEHLDEKLTVDDVAKHCGYSKYHLSRLFKEKTGEGIYAFVRRNRMAQSATLVKAFPEKQITDIALNAGFSSSNYATAFKECFNMNPAKFRQNRLGDDFILHHPYLDGECQIKTFEEYDADMEIVTLPDRTMYYRRYIDSYFELKDHWQDFMRDMKPYIRPDTIFIERSHCDPDVVENEKCISDICMSLPDGHTLSPLTVIPGGKYARYHFRDNRNEIFGTYQGLTCVWLPNSGYELAKGDFFDQSLSFDPETNIIEMYIHIPIQKKTSTNSEV